MLSEAKHLALAANKPNLLEAGFFVRLRRTQNDKFHKTPLLLAIEAGHYQVVELLREHGAKEDMTEEEKIKDIR